MAKTAKGLIEYAKAQLGKPYWYGAFGQAASESFYKQKKKQYPKYYKWDYTPEVAGQKVHDCVGLIKGYLWCDSPTDKTPTYNAKQDISANMMYDACQTKGSISTLPEVPGVLVFMDGHVGVYIGNGEVIEARGHNYGVVKTKLAKRAWKRWGYCPFITYEAQSEGTRKEYTLQLNSLRRGCKGDDVKGLQILLIGRGYSCGSSGADGSFGAATEKAVLACQADHGLEKDGIAGKATMTALLGQ